MTKTFENDTFTDLDTEIDQITPLDDIYEPGEFDDVYDTFFGTDGL